MDSFKVDMFMAQRQKHFHPHDALQLRKCLLAMDEAQFLFIYAVELKDPTVMLLISIFVGSFGVDRFLLGDIPMGVLKLLTGGLCGILTIIDWLQIMDKTKTKNYEVIMQALQGY